MEANNAAAMREALADLVAAYEDAGYIDIEMATKAYEKAKAALSAPPRNCDVGTAREQFKRWEAFCDEQDDNCTNCPCDGDSWSLASCFAKWAQLPYEEERKGGGDGR